VADPDFQLTPPSLLSGWSYRNRQPSLFRPYLPSQLGWSALTRDGQILNLGLTWPWGLPGLDDSWLTTCSAITRSLDDNKPVDPKQVAQVFGGTADDNIWDTLYGLARKGGQSLWPDVPGNKPNITKGGPASVGKVDPSGKVIPEAPDDAVAGIGIPSPAISLGKRFLFASHPDIHLYLYADKDALPDKKSLFFSGGGVSIEGKTSGGNKVQIRLGAGRDAAGGAAGFINLQIGPDFLQQPTGP
jgi:hypothetical protein